MARRVEKYIMDIIRKHYPDNAIDIYRKSELIQYFNLKSNAIHGNSKTRRSLANWYAIYSLLHFYKEAGFINNPEYNQFDGFNFSPLLEFMRSLYGGSKLQNHALNSRVNFEFTNKVPSDKGLLIIVNENKYLLNPAYLYVDGEDLTELYIEIVKEYVNLLIKKDHYLSVILEELRNVSDSGIKKSKIMDLINEDTEARIFEIISYAILANHYKKTKIYIGYSPDELEEQYLQLYKTGRTNANDGGIDFVMRPLGRFFQVTEVDNYDKYFLDIDKVLKFPITFVVKTNQTKRQIYKQLDDYANIKSGGHEIIKSKYMDAIEEVITINELKEWLERLNNNEVDQIVEDIDTYYKLEFNIEEF